MSKTVWNRAAPTYAELLGGQFTQAIDPILNAASVAVGSRVLDVGTGPGLLAAAAVRRGASAVGVDYAEEMIEAARRLHPNIRFQVADATNLPFENTVFDAVVMGFTLFLIDKPNVALSEALRVLAPAGKIAFTVWDGATPGHRAFGAAMANHASEQTTVLGSPPLMGVNDHQVLKDAVEGVGFTNAVVTETPILWNIETPSRIFNAFSPMYDLSALSSDQLTAFRAEVEENVEVFREGDSYSVPFPALLVTAEKR